MRATYKCIAIATIVMAYGCVQKSYNRPVLFELDAKGMKGVKTVGIRGNNKPLNWDSDFPMQLDPKDSLYKATVMWHTGYLFTEVKFAVNGEFELKDLDNRKIYFSNQDKTVYHAKFNELK